MKPIAWMSPDGKFSKTEGKLFYIPLYTAPQPLSDEEIISIRDSCYVQSGIDEWEFDDVLFARAIELRHGIK